jgi:hypothetical protein
MVDDVASWEASMRTELDNFKSEVEPIEVRKSSSNNTETVTYRPTYRAGIARETDTG